MASSEDRDLVEILAAYITTYTLQTLYAKAKELKEKRQVPTITDGYVMSLDKYRELLKTDSWFRKQMDSIVTTYSSYGIETLEVVINRWAKVLTPKDYIESLSHSNKLTQFHNMFINTTFKLIDHIKIIPNLRNIIDNRHDKTIPIEYKNMYKKFVDEERDLIYKKFAMVRTGKSVPTTTSQERIELRKATEVITKLKNLNTEFIDEVERCNKNLKAEVLKNKKLLQEHKNALMKIKLLETENAELKKTLASAPTKKSKPIKPEPIKPEPKPIKPEPKPIKPEPEPIKPEPKPIKPEPTEQDPEPTGAEPEPEPEPEPELDATAINLEEFGDYFNK